MSDEDAAASRPLERPYQYGGEPVVTAYAWPSTVGSRLSRSERAEVLREWIEFFAQRTPIRELTLWCRVNDTLLRALAPQTQLEKLTLKWGPYTDLSVIAGMSQLTSLTLGGASALTDLTPLTRLARLTELEIENSRQLTDYSPLGKIRTLTELCVGRSISGARTDADSLDFISELTDLRRLYWDPRVISRDYSPLLSLTDAEEIDVTGMKGMAPSLIDLEWALPGMQAVNRRTAEQRVPIFGADGQVTVMAQDITGRTVLVAPDDDEEFEFYDPFDTPVLTGPIAGTTFRTLSSTPRTRTERYRIRIEDPSIEHVTDVPPTEFIIAEYAFTGRAEGPLLIWDSHVPVPDEPAAIAGFFAGNTEVHASPLPMSQTVDASQMPVLSDGELWPLLEHLAGKTGTMACTRVATLLADRDDEFILRWTQSLSKHALALRPTIEQLIEAGIVAPDRELDAISAGLAHGRDTYTKLLTTPSTFDRKWLKTWGAAVLWIGTEAYGRKHPEVGTVTTDLTTWLDQRNTASKDTDDLTGDADPWFWGARALVRLDGQLRERILLVDLNGVPDQDWVAIATAAFTRLGGIPVAGPEIWNSPPGDLNRAEVAFTTRRHSTLPLDAYTSRYATGQTHDR